MVNTTQILNLSSIHDNNIYIYRVDIFFSWIEGLLFYGQRGQIFSMDGAKIFISHMVEARIFFWAGIFFFIKKPQQTNFGNLVQPHL